MGVGAVQTDTIEYGAVTEKVVSEEIRSELLTTTVEKFVEIPEVVVKKVAVPVVVETVVEKKVKKILQQVPEIQVTQVEDVVYKPVIQEVEKESDASCDPNGNHHPAEA